MLHLHSLLRWALLALILIALVKAIAGLMQKKEFTDGDGKIGMLLMMFAHIQLILGLYLYFDLNWASAPMGESMKSAEARFWKIEHLSVMIMAIVLITIGRIRTKKLTDPIKRHKAALIFYGISLLLILSRIPWDMSRLY